MKPLYRLKFVSHNTAPGLTCDKMNDIFIDKYYSHNHRWQAVSKDEASKMTHKEAIRVMNHLCQPRIGLGTILERV